MRRIIALALVLASLPAVHADTADIRIAEIVPIPEDGQREFIELWNAGSAAQDLTGWRIEDSAGNAYTFTGQTVGPGQRLVVWGGGDATPEGPAWSKASVWNNGGDTATLYDGQSVVDELTYGPEGHEAPAAGFALTWDDGWQHATPTPGRAPGEVGGGVTATVQNVAPRLQFGPLPPEAAPGDVVPVDLHVHDDNGDQDVVAWELHVGQARIGSGDGAGVHRINVTMTDAGATLLASATDAGGLAANITAHIEAAVARITVTLPQEGLHFDMVPGATQVVASAPFAMTNNGTASATPRIDVSDFRGPEAIPVAGNLSLGIGPAGAQEWITYTGPLTPMPDLAPGATQHVWLRLDQVPTPLAAGSYGTSFTVVA